MRPVKAFDTCSRSGRAAIAIVMAAVTVVVAAVVFDPAFATIDDARLLYVYAGYASGTPEPVYTFQSVPWSALMAGLYAAVPVVPWYPLAHFGLMIASLAVADYQILSAVESPRARATLRWTPPPRLAFVGIVHVAVFAVAYAGSVILPHFETTAGVTGAAAIMLLCRIDFRKRVRGEWSKLLGFAVFYVLTCAQEINVLYAMSVFAIVIVIWKVFDLHRGGSRAPGIKALALPTVVALICTLSYGAVMGVNAVFRSSPDWGSYFAYNKYRVAYWDYPHPSYGEAADAYGSAGWDEEFYNLTELMYFMDRRFDAESLSKVVAPFDRVSSAKEGLPPIVVAKTLWDLAKAEPIAPAQAFFVLFLMLTALIGRWAKGAYDPSVRQGVGRTPASILVGLAGLLVAYLGWRGRLPLRAWEAVTLPLIAALMSWLLDPQRLLEALRGYRLLLARSASRWRWGADAREETRPQRGAHFKREGSHDWGDRLAAGSWDECSGEREGLLAGVRGVPRGGTLSPSLVVMQAALVVGVIAFMALGIEDATERIEGRHIADENVKSVERYALAHPESIFVTGSSRYQNYDLWTLYPEERPTNVIAWGSHYLYTPVYYEQLRANGRGELFSEDFLDEGVYFIGSKNDLRDAARLLAMLKSDYGVAGLEIVDSVDENNYVMKAVAFPEGLDDGWNEVLGQWYWYEGGHPVLSEDRPSEGGQGASDTLPNGVVIDGDGSRVTTHTYSVRWDVASKSWYLLDAFGSYYPKF